MNFSLRNNLSLIVGTFVVLLEYYFINNNRDQYISILFTLVFIPVLFHTFPFKRFHLFENQKYFSILQLSSKYLIPLLYVVIFISIYDFTLLYKYSSASHIALRIPNMYLLALLFATSIVGFYLFKRHALIRKSVDSISVFIGVVWSKTVFWWGLSNFWYPARHNICNFLRFATRLPSHSVFKIIN